MLKRSRIRSLESFQVKDGPVDFSKNSIRLKCLAVSLQSSVPEESTLLEVSSSTTSLRDPFLIQALTLRSSLET